MRTQRVASVRDRYGATAFDWHAFGAESIVDLLEEVRVTANSRLKAEYRFRLGLPGLVGDTAPNGVQNLDERDSMFVVDSVSLLLSALAAVHWTEKRIPSSGPIFTVRFLTWLSRQHEGRPGRENPSAA
jgi:hypothetical protein